MTGSATIVYLVANRGPRPHDPQTCETAKVPARLIRHPEEE